VGAIGGGGSGATTAPCTTIANGFGPFGTFAPLIVTVHVPAAAN
jgi:hypothetical protein